MIADERDIKQKLAANEDITFTFVGDSITYGRAHCTADETFVAVFAQLMAKKYPDASVFRYDGVYKTELDPIDSYRKFQIQEGNIGKIHIVRSGVGGNTVRRAAARFFNYTGELASGTRSDFIFTMFGINDSLKNVPEKYIEVNDFEVLYRELLSRIGESEPKAKLIVMSATTHLGTINEYVERTYKICREEGYPLIDLFSLWEDHYDKNTENFGHGNWLTSDDPCHPTPLASKIMAKYVFDSLFA